MRCHGRDKALTVAGLLPWESCLIALSGWWVRVELAKPCEASGKGWWVRYDTPTGRGPPVKHVHWPAIANHYFKNAKRFSATPYARLDRSKC